VRWKGPYAINGALTHLMGNHNVKVGADLRRLGVALATESSLSGTYNFSSAFTGKNGVGGNEVASLLLGLPYQGVVPHDPANFEWYTKYYGGYVQDDWRVTSKFTLNYGLRLEHEDGLREVNNEQTVAFDTTKVNPIDSLVPKAGTPLAGKTIMGGLVFAGVGGAPTQQGNPKSIKPAPRVGATYAIDANTVLRGGYGLFWAPWNYDTTHHGQIGFSRNTAMVQSSAESEVPLNTLDNPVPAVLAPSGSSLGLLTGVGGTIDFVDQNKGNPKVHQYSADIQRELPGHMAITIGYIGATGRDIGFCGTGTFSNCAININQIDPNLARALFPGPNGTWNPAPLRESIPNPFFGIAQAGELGTSPTIQRGQLLRPYPEFGNIYMRESTAGSKRQYNAFELVLDKRTGASIWGGRFSYTYSRTMDNQFGQGQDQHYAWGTPIPQNNYDVASEYSLSAFDSPHRIILAPIVKVPGPKDERSMMYALAGGWTASAIVELVSGAPLNAVMSASSSDANLGLFGGRQRPNLVGDPNVSGSDQDRVSDALHPSARWFNASAYANPGPGAFGNAPRTDGDARFQFRKNVDFVLSKDTRFAGNHVGEIRFEILNLTNTPKFGNLATNNAVNSSSFGLVDNQAGFMRIWQLSFRYRF
jgi:hypothetical protein